MARTGYGAEFKAKIVIEVLQGGKSLEEIAADNELNPNMVRNWKKEFLANASMVFDEKNISREAKRQAEKQAQERERMLATIGQLFFARSPRLCSKPTHPSLAASAASSAVP